VPQKAAITMKELLVRGDLMVIEGQPHCVHYTDPATVCRAVEAYAAKV
jgi:pimeloyl-ACP methyl ester carboxylesterase